MSQQALPQGATRRRAAFGLFDADGWTWAGLKATFWFLFIIFMLGVVPNWAYYITTSKTITVGYNFASIVNLCPADNEDLPCPAPTGAMKPWQTSPAGAGPAGGTLGFVGLPVGFHGLPARWRRRWHGHRRGPRHRGQRGRQPRALDRGSGPAGAAQLTRPWACSPASPTSWAASTPRASPPPPSTRASSRKACSRAGSCGRRGPHAAADPAAAAHRRRRRPRYQRLRARRRA